MMKWGENGSNFTLICNLKIGHYWISVFFLSFTVSLPLIVHYQFFCPERVIRNRTLNCDVASETLRVFALKITVYWTLSDIEFGSLELENIYHHLVKSIFKILFPLHQTLRKCIHLFAAVSDIRHKSLQNATPKLNATIRRPKTRLYSNQTIPAAAR